MKKLPPSSFTKTIAFLLIIFSVSQALNSCKKDTNEYVNDNEEVLYENSSGESNSNPSSFLLGGNTKLITKISYDNSLLKKLMGTKEWEALLNSQKINKEKIIKSYFHNSPIEVISIPIINKLNLNNDQDILSIYSYKGEFIFTNMKISKLPNGNQQIAVKSFDNHLYYQLEINEHNKIGNWKLDKSIQFENSVALNSKSTDNSVIDTQTEDCSKKPFGACMNCLIIGICGSDWVCTVACGIFIYSCVAGAAIVCILPVQ